MDAVFEKLHDLQNDLPFLPEQERCERHTNFTEEINKIALSSNHDKIMQWIDSIETYAYGTTNE